MLSQFFQLGSIPLDQMQGWYDPYLVILSYLVASSASYIALDITGRLRDINNTQLSTTLWLIGGALAMGAGIWSMHFIGMLAFHLPMPMIYEITWTALSMLVAILASGFAFYLLKNPVLNLSTLILGGVILGFAIAAMHYTGMAAMKINMNIHYIPSLFFVSILIAIIASEAALWLAMKSNEVASKLRFRLKFVSAFVMGAAICGMHYTGMAAAVFTHKVGASMQEGVLDPDIMSISVAAVTFIILGVAFIASTYKESLNQQLLLTARQAGMAEVAASVLHNVGNVLNSINVSSMMISEKINNNKLTNLEDINQLLIENKNDLSNFLSNDPRGKHIPEFIASLSSYWREERKLLGGEIELLLKNVEHIRTIVATQQDLSRISDTEQVISVENVIEEALLISGIDAPKYEIEITRKLENLRPVFLDKVKLLQILVNLIQNAKDSVLAAKQSQRLISITTTHDKNNFFIMISDNGVGIEQENLHRIFAYGFTTKEKGHGFGLHTSAIEAKDMGGNLKAKSMGLGKGATFILELPYKQHF